MNRLANETSPYLLQHARNPVEWYPWGDEAFARARREDRPILLSVGYSACHWCHVMERESFENADIARLMNQWFVNVKVDREERPDVDDVYMKIVQLLTGRGGWPMTVFLRPDGTPYYGGTYFPPVDRHGLPGFPRVLEAMARVHRERPEEVARQSQQLLEGLLRVETVAPQQGDLNPALPRQSAEGFLRHVDTEHGGFGGAPKFPHTQAFQLLLRQGLATGDQEMRGAVVDTCEAMSRGGMYDLIGGGFHRYSVDPGWLVPHFEKMLYDNAQLPRLYLELYQLTGGRRWHTVVEETLDYLLRDMRHPAGGFFSATDADSEGEEGKYFVWDIDELTALVDPADREVVCRYWGISPGGNFEGHNIPRVTGSLVEVAQVLRRTPDDVAFAIARARDRLRAARAQRIPPLRDEKIQVAWNALAIGTLAEAGRVLGTVRYREAACRAVEFVWNEMRTNDRLLHTWTAGRARGAAFLDDHALLANALIDVFEATRERSMLDRARILLQLMEEHFHDPIGGGYFFTAHDHERLIHRSKTGMDGSVPAGNAVAAQALLRMASLTGDARYRDRAEELVRLYANAAADHPLAYPSLLLAMDMYLQGPTEVVVIGREGAPDTGILWQVVSDTFVPNRVLVGAEPDEPDPLEPARNRPAIGGRATAYVCRNFSCSAPTTDPEALRRLLAPDNRLVTGSPAVS